MLDDEAAAEEEEEEEEVGGCRMGVKASSGPREGVVADSEPDGWAVRNVPLEVS